VVPEFIEDDRLRHPRNPLLAIEIPLKVKQHLGLDTKPSWIVVDEFNEFVWPGFDRMCVSHAPWRRRSSNTTASRTSKPTPGITGRSMRYW
jgi:hypothetical protein